MNERIKELAEQAGIEFTYDPTEVPMRAFVEAWEGDLEKFAELIVKECMKESMAEIVADEEIDRAKDPLIREYLTGNNQGIVDPVVRFRNHFGVEE
jgi:hypothetical protein